MPELPTFAEAGLRGYEVLGWYGFLAPAGTPREVVTKLNGEITRALAQPDVLQALNGVGLEAVKPKSPEEFATFLKNEIGKWAKVVQQSGAKAE